MASERLCFKGNGMEVEWPGMEEFMSFLGLYLITVIVSLRWIHWKKCKLYKAIWLLSFSLSDQLSLLIDAFHGIDMSTIWRAFLCSSCLISAGT